MTRTNREVYQVSLSRGDTHKSRSVQLSCMILASFRHVAVLNIKEKGNAGPLLAFGASETTLEGNHCKDPY